MWSCTCYTTSGIWLMASQLCWDACSLEQAQVSLHSVQLTTKSLHSPGVFAVLSLKVSTTADVIAATVENHDIVWLLATGLVTVSYISCIWNFSNYMNSSQLRFQNLGSLLLLLKPDFHLLISHLIFFFR